MKHKQFMILLAAIVGASIVFLDGTIVNLALPKLSTSLGLDFAAQQWVVTGYLLSLSSLILLGGSLGDIYGYKRIYIIGLIGFGVTSLLCIVPNPDWIIAMRILHGAFGALLVPVSLALINNNFAVTKRGKAYGQWTAATAAVTAIGPLLGGLLIDKLGWQTVFVFPLPFILICLVVVAYALPSDGHKAKRRVDWGGAVLCMLGLGAVIYGLIQGPVENWGGVQIASIVAGFVLMVIFVVYEKRHSDPMLSIGLFASRNFTVANISTFALYGALGGLGFITAIYIQQTLGYSSPVAGSVFLPVAILLVLLSSRFGALSSRYGPRWFMGIGPIISSLGVAILILLKPGGDFWQIVLPGLVLFGLGLAITVAPLTTTVMISVREKDSGIASAVNNAVSRAAGLIVIAMLGLVASGDLYRNSIILCSILALLAGIISLLFVQNKRSVAG